MISSGQKSPFLLGGEILTLSLTLFISIYFYGNHNYPDLTWVLLSGFILLLFLIKNWRKLYNLTIRKVFSFKMFSFLRAYLIIIGLLYIVNTLVPLHTLLPFPMPDQDVLIALVVGLPFIGIPLTILAFSFTGLSKSNSLLPATAEPDKDATYTLIAGVGDVAETVEKNFYEYHGPGARIKGFLQCKKEECRVQKDRVVGDLKNLKDYLKENPVDEIVIALPIKPSKKVRNILAAADYHGIRVKYIPDYSAWFGKNYKTIRYGQIDVVNVRQTPLDETFSFFLKNSFDKLFSLIVLTLLAPLFLLIALLIKLESPGPVFYTPTRIGKAGKPFKIFKFRSMRENDAVTGGTLSTQKDDPRITRIGRILRKYSLDELPQFFNVLLGDMSVVGPRPHRSFLNQQFQESVDKYMVRHYFKPGITGWAQVNGWRGPTDTKEQKDQRTRHDLWYVENWSLWLDIRIIFLTVFSRKAHAAAF